MKPADFHAECPKCGSETATFSQHSFCWRSQNERCPTWRTYGGEHLHRTCFECRYIFTVLTKDFSKPQEEIDDEWLSKKVDEALGDPDEYVLFADDVDWEEPTSSERPDLP